jgi:GAF domain-containing protein
MMVTNTFSVIQRENTQLRAENQQLQEQLTNLRQFVAILNGLTDAARTIRSDAELLPLLRDIFLKALKLLNAPEGSLLLLDDEQDELVFVLVHGALAKDLLGYRIPATTGIAGWVVQEAQPALVRDVRRDTRFSHTIDEAFAFRTQSILAAPLIGDGKVLGVIEALNQPGDAPFGEMDMDLLKLLCRFAGEALADIQRANPEA